MKSREFFGIDLLVSESKCSIVLDFAALDTTGLVVLLEVLGEGLEWWWGEWLVLPQLRGQEVVGTADGLESGLGEVAEGGGTTASAEVGLVKVDKGITYEV